MGKFQADKEREWKSIQTVVQFAKNASARKSFGLWIPKLFDYNNH
ncbi:hypothetical protein V2P11_08565 [Parageobacillus toebii]